MSFIDSETMERYLIRQESRRIASLVPAKAPHAHQTDLKGKDLSDFLALPAATLSSAVLDEGLLSSRLIFSEHEVEPGNEYGESVSRLFYANYLTLPLIHGAFISDEMVRDYLLNAPVDDYLSSNKDILRYRMLMSKPGFVPGYNFVNGYISEGISNCAYLTDEQIRMISDEAFINAIHKEPARIATLFWKSINRGDILEKMVRNGFEPLAMPLQLTKGINSAFPLKVYLDFLGRNQDPIDTACCRGLIRRHPIEEIMKMRRSPVQTKMLASLYSVEELKPYLSSEKYLKGPVLENAIGL